MEARKLAKTVNGQMRNYIGTEVSVYSKSGHVFKGILEDIDSSGDVVIDGTTVRGKNVKFIAF